MWLTRCILGDGVSEDFLIDQAADGVAGQGEEGPGEYRQVRNKFVDYLAL